MKPAAAMRASLIAPSGKARAIGLETVDATKRFGSLLALDRVSMTVAPGSVHALLGENGAGKSTLVKCIAGSQSLDGGAIVVDGRERAIASPVAARALGLGMVYQHFTLAPGMTVAENLILAGGRVPALIDWPAERAELAGFLLTTPFVLDLDATPAALSVGEKQKLELLKQLYLKPRFLILDEPTSVLTPQEADQVLSYVRAVARRGECTVLMITHKFREVMSYADAVTVLRSGRKAMGAAVATIDAARLAHAMIGDPAVEKIALAEEAPVGAARRAFEAGVGEAAASRRTGTGLARRRNTTGVDEGPLPGTAGAGDGQPSRAAAALAVDAQPPAAAGTIAALAVDAQPPAAAGTVAALAVEALSVRGDRGALAVRELSFSLRRGEILGVAGVSGNGQRELVEAIIGQRPREGGAVRVAGAPYAGRRDENRRSKLRALPEEPLRNASVAALSVAQNMALRDFDRPPFSSATLFRWLRPKVWRANARARIAEYGIKAQGENAALASLSGGNVQRTVLARELAGEIDVLIAANPVFGLDFAAVAEIHARLAAVRERGGAILLVSEDLDELLELADRIVVMSEGRIVFETSAAEADRRTIGAHMGGGHEADEARAA